MLDDWDQFKQYKYKRFTDVIFRHLHVDRTTDHFAQGIQKFIDTIQKEPLADNAENIGGERKRPYKSAELVAKFY